MNIFPYIRYNYTKLAQILAAHHLAPLIIKSGKIKCI